MRVLAVLGALVLLYGILFSTAYESRVRTRSLLHRYFGDVGSVHIMTSENSTPEAIAETVQETREIMPNAQIYIGTQRVR